MRTITEEARMVMNTRRNFVNYAHVTLHDGTELNLTPSDFRISGNSFTDDWNEGESFQLGSAIGMTATLLLDNTDGRTEEIEGETVVYPHGKFSEYDFYMAYFELYIHLPDATHYQGELIDEVIPIGTFTVTTPASHGSTIEFTGVDNMHMFDRSFNECTLEFNNAGNGQTLITILNRCCADCGVAIGYSSFLNQSITVHKKPKDVTYREVVSYIAQIAGCNAVISVTGALILKYYDMTPFNDILDGGRFNPWDGVDNVRDTLDGGSFEPWTGDPENAISGGNFTDPLEYHNLTATNGTTVSTDDIHFTGIMVSYEVVNSEGSTETQSLHYPDITDWDTYAMHIDDNPFVETQAIANTVATSVWDIISPLNFRVFSCSSIQDPTIEAGDCALVYDVKGNIYPTIITNVRFVTGGMTEISCTAESPVKQNSRYVNPAARAEAKAIQKQDDYNAMVAHFNELANGSLGYYKTQVVEQGATVTYIHDQSTLAASTIIWKITAAGYFVSEDGGQSWNTGYDASTGTMLMNLIYVNGLHAKWITAGTIDAARITASVISAINNSTGTTVIDGGKLSISGIVNGINAGTTTISGGKITTNSITASQIAANAITSSELAAGAVTAGKIAADAVTANEISVNELSAINGNMGTITAGSIIGRTIHLKLGQSNIVDISDGKLKTQGTWIQLCNDIDDPDGGGHLALGPNHCAYIHDGEMSLTVDSKNLILAADAHSDERLKTDIKDADDDFIKELILNAKIKQFKRTFDLNHERFGVIAQDVNKQIEKTSFDKEKLWIITTDSEGYFEVRYQEYIPMLMRVAQLQQVEIDDLKARLEKLESIVNAK